MPPSRLLDAPDAMRFEPPELEVDAIALYNTGEVRDDERAQARRLAEAVRAGYAEGLERGQREGLAEAERQQRAAAERLARSLATLHGLERQILHEVRAEVTELAVGIASKIVREKVASGDPVVTRIVQEIFARIGPGVGRKVRLNPSDLEAIAAAAMTLTEPGSVELIADPAIERGGLLVECAEEDIDARISTAVDIFRDALEDPA